MKLKITTGRLNYEPTFSYSDGVIIGSNYFEDKNHYIRQKHHHISIYDQDFVEKDPRGARDINSYWNNKIPSEGFDPRLVLDQEDTKYHENYSATTDLAYNHFPKWRLNQRKYNTMRHKFLPEQDYAKNYGNITKFGLKEKKRNQWAADSAAAEGTWYTEQKEQYVPPEISDYCTSRRATQQCMSGKYYKNNTIYYDLKLRNMPLFVEPDFVLDVKERPYPHFYF